MDIKAQIRTELNRLVSLASVPADLRVVVTNGTIESKLTQVDGLACAFEHFAYRTDRLENASVDTLKEVADKLSQKLCYLLESISPIEIDDEACVIQMRSNPPQQDDDGTRYYELVVSREELALCRYSRVPGQPRTVVDAQVTREVFERLAEDFVGAIT